MTFDTILQYAETGIEYGAPIAAALGALGAAIGKINKPAAQAVAHVLTAVFVDFGKLAALFAKKEGSS